MPSCCKPVDPVLKLKITLQTLYARTVNKLHHERDVLSSQEVWPFNATVSTVTGVHESCHFVCAVNVHLTWQADSILNNTLHELLRHACKYLDPKHNRRP